MYADWLIFTWSMMMLKRIPLNIAPSFVVHSNLTSRNIWGQRKLFQESNLLWSYTLALWRWCCTWLSPSRPSSWSTTWQYNDIHLRGWDTTDLPDCQEDPHGGPAEDVAHVHDGDNGDEPGHDVNTGHDTILALSEMCDSWGDGVSRPTEAVYRCTVSAMRLYSDTEANTDHVHHASSKWQHWHYRSETKYWCINPFKMYSLSSSINPRCSGYKLF